MTAKQITIRNAVFDKIVSDASGYVLTDLEIAKTFYPRRQLEELDDKPHIWVVAKAPAITLEGIIRSPKAIIFDLQVHIAIQQRLQPSASSFESDCEDLTELYEQVLSTCMDHTLVDTVANTSDYLFQRIEPMKDDNDQVYSYEDLTELNIFHAIFTAFYQFHQQPT